MKRLLDIGIAMVGLILFFPIAIVVAFLIHHEDRGDVFFRQERIGVRKKNFTIYKFRTFYNGRVTKIGAYLRRTGLDEIPQLLNVLRGEMSIVGPRPLTQKDILRLGWDRDLYVDRWSIKPGITGLAQLYAGRGKKISWFFDKEYADKASVLLDTKIIVLSAVMNVFGKHIVREWLRDRRQSRTTNWYRWECFFLSRCFRPLPSIALEGGQHTPSKSLAQSLAIFQLGESGGGTIVEQVQHSHLLSVDQRYLKAIQLFVDEEHRHAEVLAKCVHALGGRLVTNNWTDRLFVFSRRLMGLRLKVLVLLAAEIVGICYYRLIVSRLPDSDVKRALQEIASDEQAHLQFHCEFLRCQSTSFAKRILFTITWYVVTGVAMIVVFIDHRRAIRDLNIPIKLLLQRWMHHIHLANEFVVAKRPRYSRLYEIDRLYI